jgi:hypothetical protein
MLVCSSELRQSGCPDCLEMHAYEMCQEESLMSKEKSRIASIDC